MRQDASHSFLSTETIPHTLMAGVALLSHLLLGLPVDPRPTGELGLVVPRLWATGHPAADWGNVLTDTDLHSVADFVGFPCFTSCGVSRRTSSWLASSSWSTTSSTTRHRHPPSSRPVPTTTWRSPHLTTRARRSAQSSTSRALNTWSTPTTPRSTTPPGN